LAKDVQKTKKAKKHKLSELEGPGKEIWEKIDAQKYVNDLRGEWNDR